MNLLPVVIAIAAMCLMVGINNWRWTPKYKCPQCGTNNGEHGEECSWRR